ncbi:MAG: PHP domain-containing protein [Acidobacteria bacterium]|nr:PHP domain-containing protein [Acidobacteriota bacterium]
MSDTADMTWFKGNTHTHTLESDGDSPPEEVAAWYKQNGYDFLVLSDHNVLTDPATLSHIVDESFLLIPGEEVTSSFEGSSVHINGININTLVIPQRADTLVGTIQKNVDAIREVEGAPHINHPNFQWSFGAEELAQVENNRLLEIYNGHPAVHNDGGGEALGLEAVWDYLLTRGQRIYGIAVDDAHIFQTIDRDHSNPGRGWVTVRARALDALEIVTNLEEGLFYASTGVDLDDVRVSDRRLEVHIRQRGSFKYVTKFIGAGGKLLAESGDNPAVFELRGPELYVRAVVYDSGGWRAWVQPVFVVTN